jgi:hypothetical protein
VHWGCGGFVYSIRGEQKGRNQWPFGLVTKEEVSLLGLSSSTCRRPTI